MGSPISDQARLYRGLDSAHIYGELRQLPVRDVVINSGSASILRAPSSGLFEYLRVDGGVGGASVTVSSGPAVVNLPVMDSRYHASVQVLALIRVISLGAFPFMGYISEIQAQAPFTIGPGALQPYFGFTISRSFSSTGVILLNSVDNGPTPSANGFPHNQENHAVWTQASFGFNIGFNDGASIEFINLYWRVLARRREYNVVAP